MDTVKEAPDAMSNPVGSVVSGPMNCGKDPRFQFAYEDLRGWIVQADQLGEVKHVKGASWQEDIGLAADLIMHSDTAPCVIFDEVPGYPRGHRVLVNFFAGRRKNMTLGLPLEFNKMELSQAFLDTYLRELSTLKHEFVESGPVMENVMTGAEVDVTRFPVPIWHERDGGRYIGTGSFNVTMDPEEKWINAGTYRVMIHDKQSVGFYISPGKHGRIHREKYQARNEPMPVVIVCGGDPLTFLMSSSEMPYGVCELDIVGGLRGKPLKVVRGKVTGLPFPANAEIVLEGFVEPHKVKPEGPFGEWTGYYGSDVREEPVMDVKAIYHRNDPILFGCPPQQPPEEQARYRAVTRSALIRKYLQQAGVPDVQAVWAHEVGGSRMLLGVSIKQRYPGHAKQAGHVASQCHAGAYTGKYVIVVDEDIDVTNLEDLMWGMLTRSDPATSIDIINGAWSTPLDPRIPPEQKARGDNTNSRAIIDACRPYHWRDKFPVVNKLSPDAYARAMRRFGYLLK